jgi:diguanylate cyclase (GGDEF)-like protein
MPVLKALSRPWRAVAAVLRTGGLACGLLLAPQLHAEQAQLRSYGQADGLGNLMVMALAQDAEGALWAGTENGLYRFDGERFHRVDRERRLVSVTALRADPRGGLWIAAAEDLYHWQEGRLQRLQRPDGRSLPVERSGFIALGDAPGAWVISGSRLFAVQRKQADGSWTVIDALDKPAGSDATPTLNSIAVDRAGTVWVGCGTSLCRLHGRQLEPVVLNGRAPKQAWTTLFPARDGSLWLRSEAGVARFDPATRQVVDHHLPRTAVNVGFLNPALAEDPTGRILTAGMSTIARRPLGDRRARWDLFDREHGMPPGGRFLTLFVDRQGGLWFSRAGSGLSHWAGYGRWEHWTRTDGLPHDVVWGVARDSQGVLHAATSNGTARFDPEARHFVSDEETRGSYVSTLLADSRGQVWISTADGAVLRRGGAPASRYAKASEEPTPAFRLLEGWDGRLWFAAENGIGWWSAPRGSAPLQRRTLLEGISTGSDFCTHRGGAWAASPTGLLRITDAGQVSKVAPPAPQSYLTSVACTRNGGVYVSDDHGRIHLVHPDAEPPRAVDITPPLLADRSVLALLEDRRGWLWANTDGGVAVWNGRQWRLLDQSQGLIWNDTSGGGLYEDRDGTLWISTSQGLSHLLQPERLFSPTLPAVRISGIVHGGQPLPAAADVRVKWSRTEALEVAIESLSHADRATQAFEHRLLGFDDAWHPTGGSVIRYAGLPAGNYTLQARLVDQQLGLSSPAATLRLEIDAPWWETWSFRLLCGALLAMLAYAGHRVRLRAARARERELAGLVAERTRELEASREELRERATKDGLTGAWNRQTVLEMLGQDLERSARDGQPLTVVLADIDHFKRINDELGHPAGDEVLRQFVARLRTVVRPYDAIGRYGGEEFVLLLRGLSIERADDRSRIETIHAAIAAIPMQIPGGALRTVTCSFGAASGVDGAATDIDGLVQQADAALYRAKRTGRNRVAYAEPAMLTVGK